MQSIDFTEQQGVLTARALQDGRVWSWRLSNGWQPVEAAMDLRSTQPWAGQGGPCAVDKLSQAEKSAGICDVKGISFYETNGVLQARALKQGKIWAWSFQGGWQANGQPQDMRSTQPWNMPAGPCAPEALSADEKAKSYCNVQSVDFAIQKGHLHARAFKNGKMWTWLLRGGVWQIFANAQPAVSSMPWSMTGGPCAQEQLSAAEKNSGICGLEAIDFTEQKNYLHARAFKNGKMWTWILKERGWEVFANAQDANISQPWSQSSRPCTTEIVSADFLAGGPPASQVATGFLHSFSATAPSFETVGPLKPNLVRTKYSSAKDSAALLRRLQSDAVVVLSEQFGYSRCPGEGGDFSAWTNLIRNTVSEAKAAGHKFQWELWNEPDHPRFWPCSWDRFLETWREGVRAIRAVDPSADIVGPSFAHFKPVGAFPSQAVMGWESFLGFAKSNGVLPTILAWHEFGDADLIPQNMANLKSLLQRTGVDIRRFQISEYLYDNLKLKPGGAVWSFANLERSGIESAAKGCWIDPDDGKSGCFNDTLNGLLTPAGKAPRSIWWAYRSYADLLGKILPLKEGRSLDGLTAYNEADGIGRILLGSHKPSPRNIRLVLKNPAGTAAARRVAVTAEKILNSENRPLQQPLPLINTVLTTVNGAATLPDFGMKGYEAVRISVTPWVD